MTAHSRSSASLRSAPLDYSMFCMIWIYAIFCNLDIVDIFHIRDSIGKTSDRLDFEPEKPDWTELNTENICLAALLTWNPWFDNGRQPKHLTGWISTTQNIWLAEIWWWKILLTEILLGKSLISSSCSKSSYLCPHVTFHVQRYKQIHKRI